MCPGLRPYWAFSPSARPLSQADIQLFHLLIADIPRRIGHHAGGTLGFGKGDHIANGVGAGHQHDQSVQTKRQATVRGRTVLQGIEQEAKLLFRLGLINVQDTKNGFLHLSLMNTNTAATQLTAV